MEAFIDDFFVLPKSEVNFGRVSSSFGNIWFEIRYLIKMTKFSKQLLELLIIEVNLENRIIYSWFKFIIDQRSVVLLANYFCNFFFFNVFNPNILISFCIHLWAYQVVIWFICRTQGGRFLKSCYLLLFPTEQLTKVS